MTDVEITINGKQKKIYGISDYNYTRDLVTFEEIETHINVYNESVSTALEVYNNRLEDLRKLGIIQIYEEAKNNNLPILETFQSKGFKVNTFKELKEKYKVDFKAYDYTQRQIKKYEQYQWSDEEITLLESIFKERHKRFLEEEAAEKEEELIEQEKKEKEEKEKLSKYLRPFKTGRQVCISLLDEETHHLVNKDREIQCYLNNGYELEENFSTKVKVPVVFLKPSDGYQFTEDFEQELIDLINEKSVWENFKYRK